MATVTYYNGNLEQSKSALEAYCRQMQIGVGLLQRIPREDLNRILYLRCGPMLH